MATPSAPDNDGRRNDRLNGWKEIALHFGKGVRTVQRWEKDLGLPVRRLGTGRGEIVFALKSELEAWREAVERGGNLSSTPGEDDLLELRDEFQAQPPDLSTPAPTSPDPSLSPRRFRPAVIASVLLLFAFIAAVVWWIVASAASQPYEARVENHALRIYDENGRFLWEHRFEFPLGDTADAVALRAQRGGSWVGDIDGDGRREVLFASISESAEPGSSLFCFDQRGRLRFRHTVQRVAWYGDIPYPGPWHPISMKVVANPAGTKAIWVAFADREQFPTVIEKLSPSGAVLGQFWHAGTVDSLQGGVYQGRHVIFAGANNNESLGAALAVIDSQKPDGSSPSIAAKFTCRNCPTAPPLAYLVFPGTEIEHIMQQSAAPFTIRQTPRGEISLMVTHEFHPSRIGRSGAPMTGHTSYVFTPDLVPLVAHHEPSYRLLHDEAYKLGILDHRFSEAEDQALKVLRWNGSAFEELPVSPGR